jgi:hypothetical protein
MGYPMDKNILLFEYTFDFIDGTSVKFAIHLDSESLKYIPYSEAKEAEWTKLENNKCKNCTLSEKDHAHCPIALNLNSILSHFYYNKSYEMVKVTVKTEERTYFNEVALQHGLASMLGIYMVSSGCPVLGKLKPMVRFHLPFASLEETIFRAASTYLLSQYLKQANGEEADWELKKLIGIYKEIEEANQGIAARIRSVADMDANINALVVLDVFAKQIPLTIRTKLKEFEYLFDEFH